MNTTFYQFCSIIQSIRETLENNDKINLFAEYLAELENDEDLNLAAQFAGEGAFEKNSGKRISLGSRTSGLAAAGFCEIDYDLVFKPCRSATGSSSETIERLMANIPAAVQRRSPRKSTLAEIQEIFEKLCQASGRPDKQAVLWSAWEKMTSLEIKYFTRLSGRGSLSTGFETKSVTAAIAKAFGNEVDDVRCAHMITGSLGKTTILAKHKRLDEAQFNLFRPLAFMLASHLNSRPVKNPELYVAEEKFDGLRAQVHAAGDQVNIFSRDLNDITRSFPEVAKFFRSRNLPPLVFDGEICVFRDNTILPFQLLQKRLAIKKPGKKILEQYPVLFIAYDLLFTAGNPIFDLTLTQRRRLLEKNAQTYHLPVAAQFEPGSFENVNKLFEQALEHGNEGLMLKRRDSTYEFGRRNKSWLKIKKTGDTFDTVIMYAHAGSNKRQEMYSDFTLGISVKDDERYEEEFIPIGKINSGYTDEDLKKINRLIKELAVEKYGPTLGLIPKLVVEIEFDDIQVNKRTKAGYTLRRPRFKTIHWDLTPNNVNTLKDVEQYYRAKLETKHLTRQRNTAFIF